MIIIIIIIIIIITITIVIIIIIMINFIVIYSSIKFLIMILFNLCKDPCVSNILDFIKSLN
jgi:hypothetical protein